ncbi:type II toxin-antitoxin system HicB family antitoxin [Aminithiophilus ramosus]|uniref:Type II toxin-antitoxin system HicB family antitoxin n=1 Tax=Aminithiophilus ramosus TaxID=3029084 RepID=A0A9Q7AQ44_9BACT|nr:type II toxin-antitoxin system HicB family antitoxin [Aminithiophilus ramosus]QTX33223.1 type II toxin-antitoxin system HicB family antitoxin [Aminithiophilus ramosus]
MANKKKPDRYIYPAIFSFDDDGVSVEFSDLPGCLTCGATQEEALVMAQDALRGHLACLEERGEKLPDPGDMREIALEPGQVLVAVEAWMLPLRTKTIRKNLTIPAYLAEAAEKSGINFSQTLSDALQERLGL